MTPTPGSLLGRISQAALIILVVAAVVNLSWHLIKPVIPAVVILLAFGLLFRFVLQHR